MSADMLLHLRVCAANIPSLAAWDNWGSQLGSNTWPASSGLPQYVQWEVSLKWSCLPPIQLSSWQTTLMAGAWPLAVTLANVFLDPRELQYHLLSRAEELCCLGDLSYSTSFQPRAAEARRPGPTEEWKHKEGSILHKEHPRLPAPLLSAVAITGGHRAPTTSIWRISPVYLWFLRGRSKKTPGQHKTDRHNQHEAQEQSRQSQFTGTLKQQQDTWLLRASWSFLSTLVWRLLSALPLSL